MTVKTLKCLATALSIVCLWTFVPSQIVSAQTPLRIEPVSLTREIRKEQKPRKSDFSGLTVPRYSSLVYNEVNGRTGPGKDYPVKWIYRRQGLPILVVRESGPWRKIRDPQGDEVWMHERMLGARRTGITAANSVIRRAPSEDAEPVAAVDLGVIADLSACEADWCRVSVKRHKGWLPRDVVWGADALKK